MKIKTLKDAYVGITLVGYVTGRDNAFEAFQQVYGLPQEGESDVEYVIRCAEQDFDDAPHQGAVYQEVFDELCS